MQDQYAGQAGTYVTDPETSERVPLDAWQAKQAAKAQADKPKSKNKPEPAQPEVNNVSPS
jgi:hypothetical protein